MIYGHLDGLLCCHQLDRLTDDLIFRSFIVIVSQSCHQVVILIGGHAVDDVMMIGCHAIVDDGLIDRWSCSCQHHRLIFRLLIFNSYTN